MTRSDFFQRSLGKNLPLKILALVLALMLWFHISRTGREYFSLTVPVNVVNLPSRLEVEHSSPDRVTLTLEGPPGFGRRLHAENLSLILDGRSFSPGRRSLRLTGKSVTLPTGVSVIRFAPKTVTLELVTLRTKIIRILPQFIGETKHRITPLRVHLIPDHATIEGGRKELANIHFLKTSPIELSRLAADKAQSFEVPITNPDPSRIRVVSPSTVTVQITPSNHSASLTDQ